MSSPELGASLRAAYVRLIEQRFGLRLTGSPARHFDRIVLQLVASSPYADPAALNDAFAAGLAPRLLEVLATRLTIGETYFFRVTPQMEALRTAVLPDLIAGHATDRRLRLWSAGCSTGEEPYTLAMLLREQIPAFESWDIQLVATDLNQAALEVARLGVYGDWSFRDAPSDMRDRYFISNGSRWQLTDSVRSLVRFAHQNLAEDPFPFPSLDLILCRNVTIYFHELATQRLYERFAEALEPAGWLILGPSDPVPAPAAGFELVVLGGALVWRRRMAVVQAAPPRPLPSPLPLVPTPIRLASDDLTPAAQPRAPVASIRRSAVPQARRPSTDAQQHLSAGMLQLDQGAAVAAIDSLRRAAFLDENSALVQFSLGRAYRQNGDLSRSKSAFRRARRLLAGSDDDQLLVDGDVATGELRGAVDAQLADLDRSE